MVAQPCPLILAPSILDDCNKANGYPLGLPQDPTPALPPPGLPESIEGKIATAFDDAWNATENVYSGIYSTTKKVIGTVYSDVRSGAGTVYDDVSKPVGSLLTGTYWYVILGVVVVAGGLYFIGKTGAIKVSV